MARVEFETAHGVSIQGACPLAAADGWTSVHARLLRLSAKALGKHYGSPQRVTSLSVQYYDSELKQVVEADAQTALGEMSAAGRPWRVLVLGYEKEVITAAGNGGGAPPLTEINLGEAPKRRK